MLRTLRVPLLQSDVTGRTPIRSLLFVWAILVTTASADDTTPSPAPSPASSMSVEELVQQVRPSLAVVSLMGRDGKSQGVGTGFVIDAEGLIATNLHVIGEGRAFGVALGDGRQLEVIAVHDFDHDVAVTHRLGGDRLDIIVVLRKT